MEIILSLVAVSVILIAFVITQIIDIGLILDLSTYIEPAMKKIIYRHKVIGATFHRCNMNEHKDIVEVNEDGHIYRYCIEYRTPPSTWKRRRYNITLIDDLAGN